VKKLLLLAAMALLFIGLVAAAGFESLQYQSALGGDEMAAIDGQMINVIVPFNSSGLATVITREKGDYCQFTVPVTTIASSATSKSAPMHGGDEYTVVPMPVGVYDMGEAQKMTDSRYGTGIHIEATVVTPLKDGGTFKANDFFVHQTPFPFTWGCVGIKGKAAMAKLLNAFLAATGTKKLTVSPPASSTSNKGLGFFAPAITSNIPAVGYGRSSSAPCNPSNANKGLSSLGASISTWN
jgi:hypothetical protein